MHGKQILVGSHGVEETHTHTADYLGGVVAIGNDDPNTYQKCLNHQDQGKRVVETKAQPRHGETNDALRNVTTRKPTVIDATQKVSVRRTKSILPPLVVDDKLERSFAERQSVPG